MLDEALALLGPVAGDVLNEAALADDVEHLEATADPQDRQVSCDRGSRDLDLERVAFRVNVGTGHIGLAVPCRRDVAAAGDAETVNVGRHGIARMEHDEVRARFLEGIAITPV
jgi:hypothetical protein